MKEIKNASIDGQADVQFQEDIQNSLNSTSNTTIVDNKINQLRENVFNNVNAGEYTWANLRKICGYEEIFGKTDNQRKRQQFKSILSQLVIVEELSNTRCEVKGIYPIDKKIELNLFDGRSNGNHTGKGIWQNNTKYVLIAFLNNVMDSSLCLTGEKQFVYYTSTYLCKVLGLVNRKYKSHDEEIAFLKNNTTIKEQDIRYMHYQCKPQIDNILKSVLNNIQKNFGGMSWRETYIFEGAKNEEAITDKYIANNEDIHDIDAIYKRKVLDEWGFKILPQVYFRNRSTEFFDEVLQMFNESRGTDYTKWYETIEICITPKEFQKVVNMVEDEHLSSIEIEKSKKKNNARFIEQVEKTTINSYERAEEKKRKFLLSLSQDIIDLIDMEFYDIDDLMQMGKIFRFDDNHLEKQNQCREAFIRY